MFDLLKQACEIATREGCWFADARYLNIGKQRVVSRDHANYHDMIDAWDRACGLAR